MMRPPLRPARTASVVILAAFAVHEQAAPGRDYHAP
jgi:hypothetical protein